ncbi:rbcL [Symbiodinium sp. CCMP2592]|nr:rbcL [Symbiodinium sp. CCMP2592]
MVQSARSDGGEFVAVQCGAWRVCSLWQRPSQALQGGLAQTLHELSTGGFPLLAFGDFNHLPHEGTVAATPEAWVYAARDDDQALLPTRWQSKRCIDFCMAVPPSGANAHLHVVEVAQAQVWLHEVALSDHRAVCVRLPGCLQQRAASVLQPCRNFGLPKGLNFNRWRTAISEAYGPAEACPAIRSQDHLDACWSQWCAKLERAFGSVPCQSLASGVRKANDDVEAVELLRDLWEGVWNRPRPPDEQVFQAWAEEWASPPQGFQWEAFTADELEAAARGSHSKAAGTSGWTPMELRAAPKAAFQDLASLLNAAMRIGLVPSIWKESVQVHLPKEGAASECQVDKMRPITILCAVWRLVGSAVVKRPAFRGWLQAWAPASCHGAIPGRDISTAIAILEERFHCDRAMLASLDLQKAFDNCSPKAAIRMLMHLGFPSCMAKWLEQVWSEQRRWLSWRTALSDAPCWAGSSLPQGDALAPLAMVAYMSSVALALDRTYPRIHASFFLDDRSLTGTDAHETLEAVAFTEQWSQRLALQENYSKLKVVARDPLQLATLCRRRPQAVAQTTRVLGIDFSARRNQADRPTARQRAKDALERASRIILSPLFRQHKRLLFRQLVVPKFCFGWFTFHTLGKDCTAYWSKFRRAAECHRQAAVPLLRLLEGHFTDCRFTAGQMAFSALWRAASRGVLQQWRVPAEASTWQGRVRTFLRSLDWMEQGPWHWSHPALGDVHFGQRTARARRHGLHLLRESWRRVQLKEFAQLNRRDSVGLRGHLLYDEQQVKATSRLFQKADRRLGWPERVAQRWRSDALRHMAVVRAAQAEVPSEELHHKGEEMQIACQEEDDALSRQAVFCQVRHALSSFLQLFDSEGQRHLSLQSLSWKEKWQWASLAERRIFKQEGTGRAASDLPLGLLSVMLLQLQPPEQVHEWPCNLCSTVLAAKTRAELTKKRDNHIVRAHPREDRARFMTLSGTMGAGRRPRSAKPGGRDRLGRWTWKCDLCHVCLKHAAKPALRGLRDHHIKVCHPGVCGSSFKTVNGHQGRKTLFDQGELRQVLFGSKRGPGNNTGAIEDNVKLKAYLDDRRAAAVRQGMEPNPGPSSSRALKLRIVTCNCNGLTNANQAAAAICALRPRAIMLQEIRANEREATLFERKDIRAHFVCSAAEEEFETVVIDCESFVLCSLWLQPHSSGASLQEYLGATFEAARRRRLQVFIAGDFNQVPEENTLVTMGEDLHFHCVRDDQGAPRPTRWGGLRAIDYLVGMELEHAEGWFLEDVIGDHVAAIDLGDSEMEWQRPNAELESTFVQDQVSSFYQRRLAKWLGPADRVHDWEQLERTATAELAKVRDDHLSFVGEKTLRTKATGIRYKDVTGCWHRTADVTEAFAAIKDQWRPIWHRPEPVPEATAMINGRLPRGGFRSEGNWSISATDLWRAAQGRNGSAGLDGWTAEELTWLPESFWHQFGEFSSQSAAATTAMLRQRTCGRSASLAASSFCRTISAAILGSRGCQQWIPQVVTDEMHGGLAQRSLETAICDLASAWEEQAAILVSLDLKKGFDYADPEHTIKVMSHGLPARWALYFGLVWLMQRRFCQLGEYLDTSATLCTRSLPQGDPFAPLAFSLLIRIAVESIRVPPGMACSIFIDDRNAVVKSVEAAVSFVNQWESWADRLGLHENSDKARLVAKRLKDKKGLLEHFEPTLIVDQARAFGVDFHRLQRGKHASQEGRREEAVKRLKRLCKVPRGLRLREQLFVSRVLSVGAWGCWLREFRASKEFGSLAKTLLRGHKSASRDLWEVLQGHITDIAFVGVCRSFGALARGIAYRHRRGRALSGGVWWNCLESSLSALGFTAARGHYVHASVGSFEWPWRPGLGALSRWLAQSLHVLREAWRLMKWDLFCASSNVGSPPAI